MSVVADSPFMLQNQNARHVGTVAGTDLKPTGLEASSRLRGDCYPPVYRNASSWSSRRYVYVTER